MSVTKGQELGHYRLVARLGAGGMGEVWLAEDATLKRHVALKVLPATVAADPERLARFQREAEAVAALSHPNIVTIHSIERDGDIRFLTMELIEGESLDKVIPRGGLPLVQVLEIGATIADALATSHEKGIIHRDLKPANIMLAGRERRVKVLDFGLAKLREEAAADGETKAALSGEGRILGTLAYMSPEQAEGKAIDSRSDLFSLGIVLYELATGERPFKGDTGISVLSAILRDTPKSVTDLRADLPKEFARIIRQCLQKDPEARYQTAKDLRNQLRALKADLDSGEIVPVDSGGRAAPPPPNRWRLRRWALGAAALVMLGIAGAGIAWRLGPGRAAPASPRAFESITVKALTQVGNVRSAAVSPDGRLVAYATFGVGATDLWLRQVATGTDVPIAPGVKGGDLRFSADGSFLYFLDQGPSRPALCRMPAMGGSPQRLVEDARAFALSPDGTRLAWWSLDEAGKGEFEPQQVSILVASQDGSGRRLLARTQVSGQEFMPLVWSPDGRSIGAVKPPPLGGLEHRRVVFDAQTGAEQSLPGSYLILDTPLWLAEGWVVSGPESGSDPNTSHIALLQSSDGSARRLTTGLDSYGSLSATADGRSIVAVQSADRGGLWVSGQPNAKPARKILQSRDPSGSMSGLDWTPDGRLVFVAIGADGRSQVWSMDTDGGKRQQLTFESSGAGSPVLSPDGRLLAYLSRAAQSPHSEIWLMDVSGGPSRQLTNHGGSDEDPDFAPRFFTPDGRWIVYRRQEREWKAPVAGGDAVLLLNDSAGSRSVPRGFEAVAMLPDGATVVGRYRKTPTGPFEGLALVRVDGGAPWRRLDGVPADARLGWPQLTRDGLSITYARATGGASNVWMQRLDGGPATQVTFFSSGHSMRFAWSRDQRQLAAWNLEAVGDVVLITDDSKALSREQR